MSAAKRVNDQPLGRRTINPSARMRASLYLLNVFGTPFVAYLNGRHWLIGGPEVALWSAETAAVMGLAVLNIRSAPEPPVAAGAGAEGIEPPTTSL